MSNLENSPIGEKYSEFPQTDTPHMHIMMECMSICAACAQKCIEEGHKITAQLRTDCTDVCALAIKVYSAQSEFSHQIMELCAQVCKRCGEECAKMQVKHCQQCADICKLCAEACSTNYSMS